METECREDLKGHMRGEGGCKEKGTWKDLKVQVRGDGECKGKG